MRSNNIDVEQVLLFAGRVHSSDLLNLLQITEQEFKQNEIELTRMCGDASVRTFWKVRKSSIEHMHAKFGRIILVVHSDQ